MKDAVGSTMLVYIVIIVVGIVGSILIASNMYTNAYKAKNNIVSTIDKYYMGEIDEEKLREGAIAGYVDGLGDEYSEYITKSEYENFSANVMGNYVGIGIYMAVYKDTNEVLVVSPIKNSPAEKAGILSGDIIKKVNGVEYKGAEGLEEAAAKIKGEAGTTVNLEISRD